MACRNKQRPVRLALGLGLVWLICQGVVLRGLASLLPVCRRAGLATVVDQSKSPLAKQARSLRDLSKPRQESRLPAVGTDDGLAVVTAL
jgi:hypothetical protein